MFKVYNFQLQICSIGSVLLTCRCAQEGVMSKYFICKVGWYSGRDQTRCYTSAVWKRSVLSVCDAPAAAAQLRSAQGFGVTSNSTHTGGNNRNTAEEDVRPRW